MLALCLLGAVLAACEGGTPASPTPLPPAASPTPVAALPATAPAATATTPPTAAPTAPPQAPATPAAPLPASATPGPAAPTLALATPDRAARTPPPAPTAARAPALDYSSGLLYLSGGDLTFYNVENQEPWRMVPAEDDSGATSNIVTFGLDSAGNRLAYLRVTERTTDGACQVESQIWILDLKEVGPRRQVAESLLPASCADSPLSRAIAQSLTFAPGGHRLAYLSAQDASGPVTLWAVNSDPKGEGAPVRLFTPAAGLLVGPQWAPDGRQIAFLQASALDPSGSYDADLTLLPIGADGAAGKAAVMARGHALPGGSQALPPFDLTWLDAQTLAFQSWNPAHGPDGAWLVDTTAGAASRAIAMGQAGLGAWSPPLAHGGRLYAYRVPGAGLAVSAPGAPGTLLASAPAVSGTGAIPPIWSADGSAVAFSTADGRLSIADRAAPGAARAVALPSVLHAAWSSIPSDPPLLAAITADGKTLGIFDRTGQQIASTTLAGPTSSPKALAWEPTAFDATTRRLLVRFEGGANDSTPFVILNFDLRQRTLTAQSGPAADDAAPLEWITMGPIPEP